MRLSRMAGWRGKFNDSRAFILIALAAGLAGCSWVPDFANPIAWYRDATGAGKNDASDEKQRNSQNLEAGSEAPYPNLASVPAPPDRAMSTVDRNKLQQGLVADRANAKYSDEQLRQGRSVPPLPGEEPPVATTDAGSPPAGMPVTGAAPGAGAAPPGGAAPAGPRRGPPVKGSEPAPQESPLTSPSVSSLPQGERPRTPPPAPTGERPRQQLVLVAPKPRAAEIPAERAAQPSVMRAARGKRASITLEAAEIAFAGDAKTLSAEDTQHLGDVAKLQKQGGGSLRVIGYSQRGTGAEAELQSFGDALDRANAVAQALIKLGVPARGITVQTAPELADGGLAAGQVVVLLEY